ncbi:MAG: AMP-binding protein, partial [bacterium]|nr:AMP-binding protein [bacterium]
MKVEIERIYPLSPMQQGMLFHWLLDNQSPTYHERKIFTLEGDIQPTLLEKSLNRLVEKYEVLRTCFVHEKVPRPMQIVLKNVTFPLSFHDYSQLLPPEKETQLQTFEENQENKRFNLVKEMPLQVSLLKLEKNRYKLYWTYHHIIMDGWCSGIVFKELLHIYRSLQKGEFYHPSPSKPYRHYIEWLEKQDKKEGMKAWAQYLSGFENPTTLPYPMPPAANFCKSLIKTFDYLKDIGGGLRAQLDQITRSMGITQNTVFQVLWALLLQRYNNTNDSLFGIVVSGRPPEIEAVDQMVGLFINTLPLRVKSNDNETLSQLLLRIQKQSGSFNNYQHLPLAEIQADHPLKNQLIKHLFVFENYPLEKELDQLSPERDGFAVTHIAGHEQTNYDLIVAVSPGSSVNIKFTCNVNRYDHDYIRQIAAHFLQLIEQAVRDINIPLQDLDLLTPPDKQQLLYDFNDTKTPYPAQKTIHQLFMEQAARTPHHIAAVSPPNAITYALLDTQSTQSAVQLKSKGLGPGRIAAIMTHRSIHMLTGILAILKTGAAYMPIDPDYPQDRIDYMLNDSNAKVLLKDVGNRLACSSPTDQAPGTPQLAAGPAYIMYTSGSTGYSKGVIINHQSAVRLVKNTNYINFQQGDRILQTGAIVFDAVTFEMWGALLNGLSLYLTDGHTLLDADKSARFLKDHQITILWLTSALFNRLSHQDPAMFSPLRVLLVGGDVLDPTQINRVRQACKNLQIINGYGPTENTTFST